MSAPASESASPPRWRRIGVPLLVFLLSFAAAWFRLPPSSRDTFWAEDAKVFSARALDSALTPWSVFTPYDGYVHLLPHTVADVLWNVLPIPVELMAQAFTMSACVIAAVVAVGIYLLTASWGINILGRLILAATTVLVPGLSFELLGNLANVHWFLLWLAPFVFLARPTRWWSAGVLGAVAFVIVTSEVQAAIFAPLLLWRLRDTYRWPMIVGVALGGAIQLAAVLGGGRTTWGDGLPRPSSIVAGYFLQVPLLGVSGSGEAASALVAYSGWIVAVAAIVPFALCALWWAQGSRRRLLVAAGIAAASFAIWTAGYALNVSSLIDFPSLEQERLRDGFPLLRYAIVPLMLLYAFVGLAVGSVSLARATFRRAVAVAVAVLCATAFITAYHVDSPAPRLAGPTWTDGLAAARATCDGAAPDQITDIWIAPWEYWRFSVACETVDSWG